MLSLSSCKSVAVAIGALMLGVAPAFGALSANTTISSVPDGANFDYTVKLTNTGSTDIGTFWFGWTPPGDPTDYDLLPSSPTPTGAPAGWADPVVHTFPAYSIEFFNTSGSAISFGQTGTFTFTSSDSPTTLQGTQFGFLPIIDSFIYQGFPEVGSFAQANPTFVAAPEPTSLALAVVAFAACSVRRRRATR
jgi:hypothetical protein